MRVGLRHSCFSYKSSDFKFVLAGYRIKGSSRSFSLPALSAASNTGVESSLFVGASGSVSTKFS